jgi:molybdopterin converting factor small subunit
MSIEILLFGPAADAAKTRRLPIPIEYAPITCGELRARLSAAAPALARYLPASRFAVNHSFVSDDCAVTPADEVALIGMVCGG